VQILVFFLSFLFYLYAEIIGNIASLSLCNYKIFNCNYAYSLSMDRLNIIEPTYSNGISNVFINRKASIDSKKASQYCDENDTTSGTRDNNEVIYDHVIHNQSYFFSAGAGFITTQKTGDDMEMILSAFGLYHGIMSPAFPLSSNYAVQSNVYMHPKLKQGYSSIPRLSIGMYYNDFLGLELAADYHMSHSLKRVCDDKRQFMLGGSSAYISMFMKWKYFRYGAGIGLTRMKISDDNASSIFVNSSSYKNCDDWDSIKALDKLNEGIQGNLDALIDGYNFEGSALFTSVIPLPTQFFIDRFIDDSSSNDVGSGSAHKNMVEYKAENISSSPIIRLFVGADWNVNDGYALSLDYSFRRTIRRLEFETVEKVLPYGVLGSLTKMITPFNHVSPVLMYPYMTHDILFSFRWMFN
jgi:hypothetical protein